MKPDRAGELVGQHRSYTPRRYVSLAQRRGQKSNSLVEQNEFAHQGETVYGNVKVRQQRSIFDGFGQNTAQLRAARADQWARALEVRRVLMAFEKGSAGVQAERHVECPFDYSVLGIGGA